MSKIKIFTPKKHRWGSKIQTLFGIFSFDGEGFSEIENSKEKEFNDYLTEIGIEIIEEIEEPKNTAVGMNHLKDDITGGPSSVFGKLAEEPKEVEKIIEELPLTGNVVEEPTNEDVVKDTGEVIEEIVEKFKLKEDIASESKEEIDPLGEIKKDLEKTKYKELHKLAKEMKLPEEEWKKLRKDDLINYLAPKI